MPAADVANLSRAEKLQSAVDAVSPAHFMEAGFDVTFVGPDADASSGGVFAGVVAAATRAGGEVSGSGAQPAEEQGATKTGDEDMYVDVEAFCHNSI